MLDFYGGQHNWHKKSIFWELTYCKDLLLRHNLDVMHIEKNVFENIMNTILNVPGKTKDNKKSRLDLPDICSRSELHIKINGQVEGSIIAGSLTEETSHFTSYYFAPKVCARKTAPRRYDDGGVTPTYAVAGVPDIFCHIGRFGGKLKEVWWSSGEDAHSAHTYILLNCENLLIRYFER